MRSRRLAWFVAAVTLTLSGHQTFSAGRAQGQTPQAPSFRTETDVVQVDVSVRAGGRPLTGLTPEDFEVKDNGVRQTVLRVEPAAMPLDITIVADVSAGTSGVWTNEYSSERNQTLIAANVQAIVSLLRPEDRLRLLTSDTYTHQVFPMQSPATARVGAIAAAGLSATYDTLVAAMSRVAEPGRRHLIVAWLKPLDTISAVDEAALREAARRSDAVLHVVQRDVARYAAPPRWQPQKRGDASVLHDVAAWTGGTYQEPGMLRDANVADTFREIFNVFRQGMVLHYMPQDVRRDGWHEISVAVLGHPGAELRARRGYGVATAPPLRASTSAADRDEPAARSGLTTSLSGLMDMFGRSPGELRRALRQGSALGLILEYRSAESPWAADPVKSAAFALELAVAGLVSEYPRTRDEAMHLLSMYHDLVRHPIQPDPFECAWYRAEVVAFSAQLDTGPAEKAVTHALTRCPRDPALLLERAIVSDQFWSTDNGRHRASSQVRDEIKNAAAVMARYDEALTYPASAFEAGVRSAFLAYRTGDFKSASTRLRALPTAAPDPVLDYWRHLFIGQVRRQEGDYTAAADAFLAALAVWPKAQSARVALMTSRLHLGDRAGAEQLSEQIQSDTDPVPDPFWVYWQGRYYDWRRIITDLSRETR